MCVEQVALGIFIVVDPLQILVRSRCANLAPRQTKLDFFRNDIDHVHFVPFEVLKLRLSLSIFAQYQLLLAIFRGPLLRMAANKSTLPAKVAVALDVEDWTLTVERGQILSAAFLKVLAEVVLELALAAEFAFLGRELVEQRTSTAEW